MLVSTEGGGAKLHLKCLSLGHYGRLFVSGQRYTHIFEDFKRRNITGFSSATKGKCHPVLTFSLALRKSKQKESKTEGLPEQLCHPELRILCRVRTESETRSSANKSECERSEMNDLFAWNNNPRHISGSYNRYITTSPGNIPNIPSTSQKAKRNVRGDFVPQKESETEWLAKQLCHPEFISGSSHRDLGSIAESQCLISKSDLLTSTRNIILPTENSRNITSASHTAIRHVRGDLVPTFTLAEFFLPSYHSPRKIAFTLAEVLITLGIIGVVAALTLPALLANQRKIEYASRLKKFNSTMSQAILMAQKDYGDPTSWGSPGDYILKDENGAPVLDDDGDYQYDEVTGSRNAYNMVMKYIAPYINYLKIEELNNEERRTGIYFADGSIAWVKTGSCLDFTFDVNGNKRPNTNGIDRYIFLLCTVNGINYFGNSNRYWGTVMTVADGRNNRQAALEKCKTVKGTCARLLELDEWEYKKDYPYKI